MNAILQRNVIYFYRFLKGEQKGEQKAVASIFVAKIF